MSKTLKAACLIASGCGALAIHAPGASAQEPPPPAVTVAPAAMQDLQASISFSGRVVSIQQIDILARVSGFVEERPFTEGADVSEGDVLYKIEDDAYLATLAEVEGLIKGEEAELKLAEIERDRKEILVAKDTVAQSELDVALAQLGKVEGNLMRLHAQRDLANLDISYATITAPFDGVIGLAQAHVGGLVGPDSGPLATLIRLDPIHVEFPIATRILLNFKERMEQGETQNEAVVRLTLANGSVYPLDGDLDFLDAAVSSGTDTVIVRASFDNPDNVLLANALVDVRLLDAEPTASLAVPQQAVQRDMAGAFVMVVDPESKVELRRIEADLTLQGYTVVTSGLEAGENVITEGVNKVRPGITVDAAVAGGG